MYDALDIISIGDVVIDAFIKLFDQDALVTEHDGKKMLSMEFGTKIPYDHVEVIEGVGNAANAAVCFARLGLKTGFVANVGSDNYGRDIIYALGRNKVDTRFVRINPGKKSNYHYVLWYGSERTILIRHEAYSYHWPHITEEEKPAWVYFSSVSEHAVEFHDHVAHWLNENPDVKFAFQPGTFQMAMGVERLRALYHRSDVLILNREEAANVSGGSHGNIHELLDKLHALGPKIVCITDGAAGAYASDGSQRLSMPIYPDPAPPLDRTGAGDAFSSSFVAALAKGQNIEGALMWGPINSMSVVQKVGAQAGLLTDIQLETYLKHAPRDYFPKHI